jgi:hypothetical protein
MKKIKAKELKPGDVFTTSNRSNAKLLTIGENIEHVLEIGGPGWRGEYPPGMKGYILVVLENCSQMSFEPHRELYLQYENDDGNRSN